MFLVMINLSSANAFNLGKPKILLSGKGFTTEVDCHQRRKGKGTNLVFFNLDLQKET